MLFHYFSFTLAETFGEEQESIHQTAILWKNNVSAFIGPQETCEHEARLAASVNLPMISHFCTDTSTSNKVNIFIYHLELDDLNQVVVVQPNIHSYIQFPFLAYTLHTFVCGP